MVICPDCGKDVPEAKFCKNCGAYISNVKKVTVPVAEESLSEEIEVNQKKPVKFCYNCGYKLPEEFKFCPNCGQNLGGEITVSNNRVVKSRDKSTILAVVLSMLLPGLGQIYLGLDHKGAVFLIAYVVSAILILLIIGFVLCFIIWIWALIDTIKSASALNRGEEVKDKLL